MANEEHFARFLQGVTAWNAWRNKNAEIMPNLDEANLNWENLTGFNLSMADLTRAALRQADLTRMDLTGVRLIEASLTGALLTGANLTGANLTRADLREANLTGAALTGARLIDADLSRADLTKTDLTKAEIGWTKFGDVDLSVVHGLDTVVHQAPSTIGIDTLYLSRGNIPEVFLRAAGVPDDMITYSKSLVGQPFQNYSCFISYSSRDEALAQRLHADLRDKGVRCWFAPEDMKIGDEFRSRIDESIQLYDRLLLILSEHSVKSLWVRDEVEAAFDKEGKENRRVLFPIRIDEAITHVAVGWAAAIGRQRYIGDFRQWKDHDAYQKAFQRLLRDLKADI
jgi:TIR domain/Pentapeptide repeats (8 copies)